MQTINLHKKQSPPVIQYNKNVPTKPGVRQVLTQKSYALNTAKKTNQKQINPTDKAYHAWVESICKHENCNHL